MRRPAESLYFSTSTPPALATLNDADTLLFLNRLDLPSALLHAPPSLELLAQLQLALHLRVPFDVSSLHVPQEDWSGPSKPIQLGGGIVGEKGGMNIQTEGNFKRVVEQRRGGFCFSLNTLAAALLRGFGFRVSEVGTRVFLHRGKDPAQSGYWWSPITHELLIVDWPATGSERWMVDVGFGGGACPLPIRLVDGATSGSLSASESFLLRAETLPIGDLPTIHDSAPGYTLYRRVCPPEVKIADAADVTLAPGCHWSPCVHFSLQTILPEDITMLSYYNESHPKAPFVNFFVVSRLLPSGARKTLSYPTPGDNKAGTQAENPTAKLYTKEGILGREFDVSYVPFTTAEVRQVLAREFDFKFE